MVAEVFAFVRKATVQGGNKRKNIDVRFAAENLLTKLSANFSYIRVLHSEAPHICKTRNGSSPGVSVRCSEHRYW